MIDRECPTGTDHELPARPTFLDEMIAAFGNLLDAKLGPLTGQLGIASGVFEVAAQEFRSFAECQTHKLERLEERLKLAEEGLASLRLEVDRLRREAGT